MDSPRYTTILSKEERASAMRFGATLKFAEHGVRPSQIDSFSKKADLDISAGGILKAVALTSLIAGVPLGAASHVIGRHISGQRSRETELKAKAKFYREAARNMETGLAATGAMV